MNPRLPRLLAGLWLLTAPVQSAVPRYDVFEQSLSWNSAPYSNPWEQVSVSVTITPPSGGSATIGGFFHSANTWKFRFSPAQIGTYTWSATITDTIGTQPGIFNGSLDSVSSANPGRVIRNPTKTYRWITSDGQPFYPLGFGDCVLRPNADASGPVDNPGRPVAFYMDAIANAPVLPSSYFNAFGDPGARFNVFRWGPDNCSFGLYSTISPSGNFYLAEEGRQADTMIQAARQNGVRIYQVLFGFSPPFPNGATAAQFAAIKRYVKYMADRFGAYVDFWELMNEAFVDSSWYSEIAGYLRSVDPYGHAISTSWEQGGRSDIDILSPHWYQNESEFSSDQETAQRFAGWKSSGKPVIVGEQGNAITNWDPGSALRMRLRTWTAFFSEGGLVFWNTSQYQTYAPGTGAANIYLGPTERSYIRVLQTFTGGFDATASPVSAGVSDPGAVRAYALGGASQYAAYVHAYTNHSGATNGISLSINPGFSGTATWIRPSDGATLGTQAVGAGQQNLAVPSFVTDIALKIISSGQPALTVASLVLNPPSVNAGQSSTATVTLSGPAPPNGISVALASQHPCCLIVPSSVLVPGNQNSAQFTVGTTSIGQPYSGWVSASLNGSTIQATLSVQMGSATAPTAVSVTPNTGTGSTQTFSFAYSDPGGYTNLNATYGLFNSSLNGVNACYFFLNRAANAFYLLNDANTALLGPVTPGGATDVQNSQCVLKGAGSSFSGSGNTLTMNVALTLQPAFSGTKTIFMYAANNGGLNSGWQNRGAWATAPNQPPTAVSVTPASGSGASQTFSLRFSDANGTGDLSLVYVLVNSSINGTGACFVAYSKPGNVLYLVNDAGAGLVAGAITPGGAGTLTNSQCTLASGGAVTPSGNDLTVPVNLTFKSPAFSGARNVYMYAVDSNNANSGWQARGTWVVP